MAKAMSKSQIAATVSEKVGISKKQAVQAMDTIAELAYKQAKNTFTVPGLGKLVLVAGRANQECKGLYLRAMNQWIFP